MALIDLGLLKRHLRLAADFTAEDQELDEYRQQAEELVINFITRPDDDDQAEEIEGWTEDTCPASIKAAVLKQAMEFYRFRGDDEEGPKRVGHGALAPDIEATLIASGYRRPVIA